VAEPIMAQPALVQRHTELIRKANTGLLGLYVADDEGTSISFSPPFDESGQSNRGRSFADREYYAELIQTQRPTVSSLIMSEVFGGANRAATPLVIVGYPILGESGVLGYAAGLLDFSQ